MAKQTTQHDFRYSSQCHYRFRRKLKLLAQPIRFEIVDPVPWNDPILIGPFHDLQIYMTILTLLQFEFSVQFTRKCLNWD